MVRPLFDLRPEVVDSSVLGRPLSCVSCGLYKGVASPRMPPWGGNRRGVMIIGEGPGETEDERGKPWQGRTGRMVRSVVADCGLDLEEDCVSLNAVNCRATDDKGHNREPSGYEVACCRSKIVNPAIQKYDPGVILLMGGAAISSVLGPLCAEAMGASVYKWRGMTIPVPELRAWVCPTWHPSYVAREAEGEKRRTEVETIWKADVARALKLVGTSVPGPEDLRSRVELLLDEGAVLRAIYEAHGARFLSYDYETTGLRARFHSVVCASFCYEEDRAFAFMMPKTGPVPGAWAKLMANKSVGKISHNMKFENEWTLEHFDVEEIEWAWDSMIAAHVEDNRLGICGLKNQAFLNFGTPTWESLIDSYLKSTDKRDPRAPNRLLEFIEKYGEQECLIYCGIDSLVAYRLAMRQRSVLGA